MSVTYGSAKIYIESVESVKERLDRVCQIIDGLENLALSSVDNQDIDEYWVDDGQTKIKTIYRSPTEIIKAIKGYDQLKQYLLSKLNGRSIRLVDYNTNNLKNKR